MKNSSGNAYKLKTGYICISVSFYEGCIGVSSSYSKCFNRRLINAPRASFIKEYTKAHNNIPDTIFIQKYFNVRYPAKVSNDFKWFVFGTLNCDYYADDYIDYIKRHKLFIKEVRNE